MNLNETIKQIRRKEFLSQQDFAKEIGVAFSTVNRWELGKTKPNYKAMKSIKAFCDENKLDYSVIENEWIRSGGAADENRDDNNLDGEE